MQVNEEQIKRYNVFRRLCLKNAEDAIRSAEVLIDKKVNHIVFHLLTLALEELGKIFIGWSQTTNKEEWGKDSSNYSLEDHVKKLFWAIWGPTLKQGKFAKDHVNKTRGVANSLHLKRLSSLYTSFGDTANGAEKIRDDEISTWLGVAKSRLEFELLNGDMSTQKDQEKDDLMAWFMKASEDKEKRGFIFGDESIAKLETLLNSRDWLLWLKTHFEEEALRLKDLLQKELTKTKAVDGGQPKWRITFKLVTPSHSIRSQELKDFNNKNAFFKLNKGASPHILNVELTLLDSVPVNNLYQTGWLLSKILVGSLCVGNGGIFYWNTVVDTDRYYDEIFDFANNSKIVASLATDLRINWREKRMVLDAKGIAFTLVVFGYFTRIVRTAEFGPVDAYLQGLAMLAKTDVHLRLEAQAYFIFFESFYAAVTLNQKPGGTADFVQVAYEQLDGILKDKATFSEAIELGLAMQNNRPLAKAPTLTNVIQIKQYCDLYFLTLAQRRFHGDEGLKLVIKP